MASETFSKPFLNKSFILKLFDKSNAFFLNDSHVSFKVFTIFLPKSSTDLGNIFLNVSTIRLPFGILPITHSFKVSIFSLILSLIVLMIPPLLTPLESSDPNKKLIPSFAAFNIYPYPSFKSPTFSSILPNIHVLNTSTPLFKVSDKIPLALSTPNILLNTISIPFLAFSEIYPAPFLIRLIRSSISPNINVLNAPKPFFTVSSTILLTSPKAFPLINQSIKQFATCLIKLPSS